MKSKWSNGVGGAVSPIQSHTILPGLILSWVS